MIEGRKKSNKDYDNDDIEKADKRTAIFEEYKAGRGHDVKFSSNISQEDQVLINRQLRQIRHVIDNYLLDT